MCPEFGGKDPLFEQAMHEASVEENCVETFSPTPEIVLLQHFYAADQKAGRNTPLEPLQTVDDIDLDPILLEFRNEIRRKQLALTPEEKQRIFAVTYNQLKNKKPQPEEDSDEEKRFQKRLERVRAKYENGEYNEETPESRLEARYKEFEKWLMEHPEKDTNNKYKPESDDSQNSTSPRLLELVRERVRKGEISDETLESKRLLFAKWLHEHERIGEADSSGLSGKGGVE